MLPSLRHHGFKHFYDFLSAYLFFNFVYYFSFWLCWVFVAAHRLPSVAASWGYSLVAAHRLSFHTAFHFRAECSLQWLLLLWITGSRM